MYVCMCVCVWISVLVNIFLLLLQLQLLLMKEDLVFSSSRIRFPDVICPAVERLCWCTRGRNYIRSQATGARDG